MHEEAEPVTLQVPPQHYFEAGYDTKERFAAYWHQLDELLGLKVQSVLEIGVGNGFVSDYLRRRGLQMVTIDLDPALVPDTVGTITALPFRSEAFDAVACYEVLEHLPYDLFPAALEEIHRVAGRYASLSLPDCTRAYRVGIQIPKLGDVRLLVPVPKLRRPAHVFDGQHFWEIGKAGYELGRITQVITQAGFEVVRTYRVYENPYHRFFLMQKR